MGKRINKSTLCPTTLKVVADELDRKASDCLAAMRRGSATMSIHPDVWRAKADGYRDFARQLQGWAGLCKDSKK